MMNDAEPLVRGARILEEENREAHDRYESSVAAEVVVVVVVKAHERQSVSVVRSV